jgi:hypothetical protein
MAKTDVCSGFNAKQDEEVNFTNSTGKDCEITGGSPRWPFTDGPPLCVPPGGCKTKIIKDLPNGKYTYEVSCCPPDAPKSVTVP